MSYPLMLNTPLGTEPNPSSENSGFENPGSGGSIGLVLDALRFAAEKHRLQRRKDDVTPYINHPIALAHILWHEAAVTDPQVLAAALLHDTVEDTGTQPEELAEQFGAAVRDLVMELTDDKTLTQAERKQHQIDHAPSLTPQARLVKMADKIANLRDILAAPPQDWSIERKQAYFEWAKRVVDQIRGTHSKLDFLFDQTYQQKP